MKRLDVFFKKRKESLGIRLERTINSDLSDEEFMAHILDKELEDVNKKTDEIQRKIVLLRVELNKFELYETLLVDAIDELRSKK